MSEKHWRSVMLNVSKLSEFDLSTIDVCSLRPEERDAVIREVIRRASAERARVMRALIKWPWLWWHDRKRRHDSAVATYARSFIGRNNKHEQLGI